MRRVSVRVDDTLYERLNGRVLGADLSFSSFIRSVLVQAADPHGRYIYSSQDEVLATCIQILTILASSVGQDAPEVLQRGMADASSILRERGLLGPEQGR